MTSTPRKVDAPSSKSASHRAMIAAALAPGESEVNAVLESDDLYRTREALIRCGAEIEAVGPGSYKVRGMPHGPQGGSDTPVDLDVSESGTTCRLITAVVAAGRGLFRIHGAERMHERPIGHLAQSLESQGVKITYEGRPECPPLVIKTIGLQGGNMDINLSESSQYLSGLLLAAPLAPHQITICVTGPKVVSWPYVALTIQAMEDYGVCVQAEAVTQGDWAPRDWRSISKVVPDETRFRISPATYQAGKRRVEGDWSNASYFLAAGAVGSTGVTISGLRKNSLQGDKAMLDILCKMGAQASWNGDTLTVMPGDLHGVDVDMSNSPDIVPSVAVAASFAKGPTTIRNVAHLRIKECDRLAVVGEHLERAGVGVTLTDDSMRIDPVDMSSLRGKKIEFKAHNDHRMAMCAAIFEFAGVHVSVDDPTCVKKSFPDFWDRWEKVRPNND